MAATLLSFTALVAAFVTVFVTCRVRGAAVCQLHKPTDDGRLSFEEGDFNILAFTKQFKEIYCRGHNFCDIRWTKNHQPLPLSENVKLLHQNQTLQFKSLDETDAGVYVCEASNGLVSITRMSTIIPIDHSQPRLPIDLQNQRCSNASADIGGRVTFSCEFYIEKLGDDNPVQASPDSIWLKVNHSAAQDDFYHAYQNLKPSGGTTFNESQHSMAELVKMGAKCEYSDCSHVYVFTLVINNISKEAFGTYELTVTNGGLESYKRVELIYEPPAKPPPVRAEDWHQHLTIPFGCLVGLAVVFLLAGYRFKTDMKLRWKDAAGKRDESKAYDVYLSYDWNSEMDQGFAITLAKRLEKLNYKVSWEKDLLPGGDTEEDILDILDTSSRCVIIFSPDYLSSRRNRDIITAMDSAMRYKSEIVPLIYRDISSTVAGEDQGTLVRQILSMPCLHYDKLQQSRPVSRVQKIVQSVTGSAYSEKSLHKELLLRLPPPPRTPPPSGVASNLILVSSEVPQYVSSRESVSQYEQPSKPNLTNGGLHSFEELPRIADIPTIQTSSKIYPDISGLSSLELNVF